MLSRVAPSSGSNRVPHLGLRCLVYVNMFAFVRSTQTAKRACMVHFASPGHIITPGTTEYDVPGGLVGGPSAYYDHFCGFNYRRLHIVVETFSCIQTDCGKRESVS